MFDWREFVWKKVLRPLDDVARSVGFYTETTTGRDEYVGTVDGSEEDVEATLRDLDDVSRSLLSSVHVRERAGRTQAEDSAFVYRDSLFAPFQVHIIVFATSSTNMVDLYAHFERNPWATPFLHVKAADFDAGKGVRKARRLLFDVFDWHFQRSE